MDLSQKHENCDVKAEFIDKLLDIDESNNLALYAKSLIHYRDGQIEESAEMFNKATKSETFGAGTKAEELKAKLIDLLEPKPPTKVFILDELKKENEDLKHHESFLLNFMTFPTPKDPPAPRPRTDYVSQFGTITMTSFKPVDTSSHPRSPECTICNKTFSKMYSLHRHMQLHTGVRNFACPVCERTFVQKSDMQRHKVTHSSEMNVACTHTGCQKRFKTTKNMRNHLNTHSTERPFKCQFCSKDFKIKRLLQFHEGLHKDIKDFNCDFCGKGFPAKPYLKSHMKVHLSEKTEVCPYCENRFKRRYDMNHHVQNMHKRELEKDQELKVEIVETFVMRIQEPYEVSVKESMIVNDETLLKK